MPGLSKNADIGCNRGMAVAISFGIDTSFLVAILICLTILLSKFIFIHNSYFIYIFEYNVVGTEQFCIAFNMQ